MDVSTLKSQIKTNQLYPFLIFTGEEWMVQKIYINQIAKVRKQEVKRIESITEIYGNLKNKSFLSTSYIYVARDDKEFMQNEKIQAQLSGILGDNLFILLLTNVDKRTKFYKQYKDSIIEFEPLKDVVLEKYIKKEIDLSDKNCQKLIEICEHDYGRCLLEIDKIKRYVNTDKTVDGVLEDGAFAQLLKDGTIHQPAKDAIFDFVDAVLDRKINKSFDLLKQCYEVGESTMVMLSVLYNNAKAVLQLQTCESKDVSKSTGLTGFQIMNAKKHTGNYDTDELIYLLRLIHKCEKGIKVGTIEEQFVMEYLLVHVL